MNPWHRWATRFCLVAVAAAAIVSAGCASRSASHHGHGDEGHARPVVVIGPNEGTELWFDPTSQKDVGDGAVFRMKVDHISVPYAEATVITQRLGATGILVHLHTFEDEILYVLSGEGSAVVGEAREEIALEPGSVVYVPKGQWHGVKIDDPVERMEILIVTIPSTIPLKAR